LFDVTPRPKRALPFHFNFSQTFRMKGFRLFQIVRGVSSVAAAAVASSSKRRHRFSRFLFDTPPAPAPLALLFGERAFLSLPPNPQRVGAGASAAAGGVCGVRGSAGATRCGGRGCECGGKGGCGVRAEKEKGGRECV